MAEKMTEISVANLEALRLQHESIGAPTKLSVRNQRTHAAYEEMLGGIRDMISDRGGAHPTGIGNLRTPTRTLEYMAMLCKAIGGPDAQLASAAYDEMAGLIDDLKQIATLQRRERAGLDIKVLPINRTS